MQPVVWEMVLHIVYCCSFAAPRYIPECLAGKSEITVEEVKNLNKMNEELASALSLRNKAFTSFQHGNFTCVQLTMVRYSKSAMLHK